MSPLLGCPWCSGWLQTCESINRKKTGEELQEERKTEDTNLGEVTGYYLKGVKRRSGCKYDQSTLYACMK